MSDTQRTSKDEERKDQWKEVKDLAESFFSGAHIVAGKVREQLAPNLNTAVRKSFSRMTRGSLPPDVAKREIAKIVKRTLAEL
jgi:hypothetical protein